MNLYNQPQFNQSAMSSPMRPHVQQGTPQSGRLSSHDQTGSGMHSQYGSQNGGQRSSHSTVRQPMRTQSLHVPDHMSPAHGASPLSAPPTTMPRPQLQSSNSTQSQGFERQPQNPVPGSVEDRGVGGHTARDGREQFDGVNGPIPVNVNDSNYNPNNQNIPWDTPEGGWPSTMVGRPHMTSVYKNAYSSTGFDMLGVLVRPHLTSPVLLVLTGCR